jgi:hypothetical protein
VLGGELGPVLDSALRADLSARLEALESQAVT